MIVRERERCRMLNKLVGRRKKDEEGRKREVGTAR